MSFDARAHWNAILFDAARRPPATAFVNFECTAFDPEAGWCEGTFLLPPEAANPAGDAQGGFVSVMLDEVMSIAGSIVQGGPAMSPTLQMTTSFLRPVPIGVRLIGRGDVLRRGRSAIFTQGVLRLENGTVLAQATASCLPRAFGSAAESPPA